MVLFVISILFVDFSAVGFENANGNPVTEKENLPPWSELFVLLRYFA